MLITDSYREANRDLHARDPRYGATSGKHAQYVRPIADWGRVRFLDYGAGKQKLAEALGPAYKVTPYDPCVEGIDQPPEPHEAVVCMDVLEHVEPDCLDDVMRDLRRVTLKRGLFLIHTGPAEKELADGRNAHLIQKPKEWWIEKVHEHGFQVNTIGPGTDDDGNEVAVMLEVVPC